MGRRSLLLVYLTTDKHRQGDELYIKCKLTNIIFPGKT